MSIEKTQAKVISSIWQAVAQSDVDLSTISKEEQSKLVGKIAENVMVTFNALMDEEAAASPEIEKDDESDEDMLWQGRPFLSLAEKYIITSERIKVVKGVLSRDVENFELIRVQDIDYKQGVSERIFGVGDVTIHGHDSSDPKIVLRNISKPEEVYEILRKAWLEARKRHGLQFREFM